MVAFKAWPVVGLSSDHVWSQTVVLHDKASSSPIWIICMAFKDGDQTEEIAQSELHAIGETYASAVKSSDSLLAALKHFTHKQSDLAILAIHVEGKESTCFGYGNVRVQLTREGQQDFILSNLEKRWLKVSGVLAQHDVLEGFASIHESVDWLWFTDGVLEQHATDTASTLDLGTAGFVATLERENVAEEEVKIASKPAIVTSPWWKRFFAPKVEETAETRAHHRKVLLAGWMVLAILIISVGIGARARSEQRLAKHYNQLSTIVSQSIHTAEQIKSLDQVKARQTIREAKDELESARGAFRQNDKWLKKYEELVQQTTRYYEGLAAEVAVNEVPLWYSLAVVRPEMKGTHMSMVGDGLVVFDANSHLLATIDIVKKRGELVAGGETIQGGRALAATSSKAYVLQENGVVEVNLKTRAAAVTNPTALEWRQPQLLGVYNGNLYMVDGSAGEIWRLANGVQQRYFGPGVVLNYTDVVSMAIDGDVWLLRSNGNLLRYRRGAPVSFQWSGLDTQLGQTRYMSVSQEGDVLVIMDQTNQRVVVFDKNGVYQKQLKWSGFSTAQAMSLSDDGKSLYILKDGSIYLANL